MPILLGMLRRICVFMALVVAASSVGPLVAGASGATEWVVQFHPWATPEARAEALDGLTVVDRQAGGDFALVEAAAPPRHPAVAHAGPPVELRAAATPDDPFYGYQWHLHEVDVERAWDLSTGAGVTVAVLDSGIAYEDFEAYRRAPDLAQTAFAPGWDFVNGDAHPNDDHGHGTHVAGTIAQSTGNGIGLAGVAPASRLMPVKVLDDAGVGTDWDIAEGLRFAADHGAKVANLSFGSQESSKVVEDAVAYAVGKGVTVVAATGNEGGAVSYPAALPDVIAVGAVRYDGTRPAYSNSGPQVDLAAPGGDLSLDQNGDSQPDGVLQQTLVEHSTSQFCWCFFEGTSMAAPHVSGVAALLISQGRATTPELVRTVLLDSALDLGPPGPDDATGHGLVQAYASLLAAADLPHAFRTFSDTARSTDLACPPGAVPEDGFTDVGAVNPHEAAVDCVAWWGVAGGTGAGTFAPAADITRAQMATMLARVVEAGGVALPEAPPDAFADDEGSPHEARIDQLAAAGIVAGTGAGRYSPSAPVTRGQMATFVIRALEHVIGTLGPATGDRFTDDDGLVHEPAIELAAELGVAVGVGPATFAPAREVRRDQMASFVARGLDLLVEAERASPPGS